MHEVEKIWKVSQLDTIEYFIFHNKIFFSKFLYFFHFSLFESSQSLFWASFGTIGLENFELEGIKSYTRFWGEFAEFTKNFDWHNFELTQFLQYAMLDNFVDISQVS